MKNPWVIIGIIAAVLFGGSIWYSSKAAEQNNEGIAFESHIKGNKDASVKLVEYSDFQCPACASFQPVVADVLSQFGDKISFEYKHFPLPIHPLAEPAARAAEAAGQQDVFFEFHDKLFENQTAWSSSPNPMMQFTAYAEELDLDVEQFRRHYGASLIRERVREDLAEARDLGLTGTPTFYLNGERMVITTYEDFINQITLAVNPDAAPAAEAAPAVEFGI
jgi:protein-disulfide isomerase